MRDCYSLDHNDSENEITNAHNMENLLLLYIVRFVFDNKLPFRVLVVLTKADKVSDASHIFL